MQSHLDDYNVRVKKNSLHRKDKVLMPKEELNKMMSDFEQQVRERVRREQELGIEDPGREEREMQEKQENFMAFNQMLT